MKNNTRFMNNRVSTAAVLLATLVCTASLPAAAEGIDVSGVVTVIGGGVAAAAAIGAAVLGVKGAIKAWRLAHSAV